MTRRLIRVLPLAFPLVGLSILFLVGRAVYQDRLVQLPSVSDYALLNDPSDDLLLLEVERLPSVDIERLPPVESGFEIAEIDESHAAEVEPQWGDLFNVQTPDAESIQPPVANHLADADQQAASLDESQPFGAMQNADMDTPHKAFAGPLAELGESAESGESETVEFAEPQHSEIATWQPDVSESFDLGETEPFAQELPILDPLPQPEFSSSSPTLSDDMAQLPVFEEALPFDADSDPVEAEPASSSFAANDLPVTDATSKFDFEPQASHEGGSAAESAFAVENETAMTTATQVANADVNAESDPDHTNPNQSKPHHWSPVDIRSIKIDKEIVEQNSPTYRQASQEGKRQAETAVQLGFELVQRGAPYSARARFIEALRVVARSLDDRNASSSHTAALRRALAAYNEAGDFFPKSTRPDQDIRVDFVVGGHATDLLKNANVQKLTPGQCVREYVAYAEQEFAKALGAEEIGSRALYGLGRLEWATATTTSSSTQVRTYRAMSLYQSAIVVNQQNFAAANELGVLLARHGKYDAAITALSHSVKHSPQPTAWRNLANLYRRLGNVEQAQRAEMEATRAASQPQGMPYAVANPRIEWVEPNRFSSVTNQQADVQIAPLPAKEAAKEPVRTASAKKQTASRRPWPFGRSITR